MDEQPIRSIFKLVDDPERPLDVHVTDIGSYEVLLPELLKSSAAYSRFHDANSQRINNTLAPTMDS